MKTETEVVIYYRKKFLIRSIDKSPGLCDSSCSTGADSAAIIVAITFLPSSRTTALLLLEHVAPLLSMTSLFDFAFAFVTWNGNRLNLTLPSSEFLKESTTLRMNLCPFLFFFSGYN